MKTLIFNGSPRKKGDTVALIDELIRHLDGDVQVISAYDKSISPCIDCRYCWEHSSCAIHDGMDEVYRLIDEVDNVIIASPIYFSELTGELLSLFSRLQLYYAIKYIQKDRIFKLKKKNGALILAGGGDGSMDCAEHTAEILFRLMNVKSLGTVLSHNTNHIPVAEDSEALQAVRIIARQLNKGFTRAE